MTWVQSQCLQLIFSKWEVFPLNFEQPQCSIFEMLMPLRQREAEKAPGTVTLLQSLLCYSHNAIAKIALEGLRLVSLHLPVLHGVSPERSVQLGDVHGRGTLLILRRILANPVMQIHSRATRGSFALEEARKLSEGKVQISAANNAAGQGETGWNPIMFHRSSAWSQRPDSGEYGLHTYCTEACLRCICF